MPSSLIPYVNRASHPASMPIRIIAVEGNPTTVDQRLDQLTRSVENLQKTMDRFASIYESDRAQNLAQQRASVDPEDKILQLEAQMTRQLRIHAQERLLWQKERKKLKKQLADCQARLRKNPTKDTSTQINPLEIISNPGLPNYMQPFRCYKTYGGRDDLERHQANEFQRPPTKYDELCEKNRAIQLALPAPPKLETKAEKRTPEIIPPQPLQLDTYLQRHYREKIRQIVEESFRVESSLAECFRAECSLAAEDDSTETPIVLEAEDASSEYGDATEWEFVESEAKKSA